MVDPLRSSGSTCTGMPYTLAPERQKHIASILWLGAGFPIDKGFLRLRQLAGRDLSHDNLFHTLLGSIEIRPLSARAGHPARRPDGPDSESTGKYGKNKK